MLVDSFYGINSVKITGMNPKASFGNISQQAAGYCTLRFAGYPIVLACRIIQLTLQISLRSFSASFINLTCKLQSQMTFRLCTLFLKLGSHYNLPIPMRFALNRTLDRPMSNNAILAALRRMGYDKETMTGHGFRAMARTLLEKSYKYDLILLNISLPMQPETRMDALIIGRRTLTKKGR